MNRGKKRMINNKGKRTTETKIKKKKLKYSFGLLMQEDKKKKV